jgi:hypothetical protein
MNKAPALDCSSCGRRIGKRGGHYLMKNRQVLCGRCIDRLDRYDDLDSTGTRAGIAWRLGLWPEKAT